MAKRGRPRKQSGVIPTGNVSLIANNQLWYLFRLNDYCNAEWDSLKLVFAGKREHKANFRFGWNGSRFSKCTDMSHMQTYYPELLSWISDAMKTK